MATYYGCYDSLVQAIKRTHTGYVRKLSQWLIAKRRDDDSIDLELDDVSKVHIGRVYPDNTFEFTMSYMEVGAFHGTLSALNKYIAVGISAQSSRWVQNVLTKSGEYPYYPNMRVNLESGALISPPSYVEAWQNDSETPAMIAYQLAVKDWLEGVYLRDKVHAFESIDFVDGYPNWLDETRLKVLSDAIRNTEYPTELMADFKALHNEASKHPYYLRDRVPDDLTHNVRSVVETYRLYIATAYGAYGPAAWQSLKHVLKKDRAEWEAWLTDASQTFIQ